MSEVVFLTREQRRGTKTVIGPVTGIPYTITAHATPVSEYDVGALLEMTEAPCCGSGPFVGMVRSFGVAVPTANQMAAVPPALWEVELPKIEKKTSRVEKLYREKKYEKPVIKEPVIEEEVEETLEEDEVKEEV